MKRLLLAITCFLTLTAVAQTETEAKLNVLTMNTDGKVRTSETITLTDKEDESKKFSCVTGEDGKCSLLVPKGRTYNVSYRTFGDETSYTELEIPGVEGYINFDFTLEFEIPKVITLKNVLYDTGKATFRPASYAALDDLVDAMKTKSTMKIEIGGHTDDVGEADINQKLSEARANAVRDYLIKKGIEAERVTAVGYGETRPIATNESEDGRQKNRRTEVRILSE